MRQKSSCENLIKNLARRLITKNRHAKGHAKKKLIIFSKNHHARRLIRGTPMNDSKLLYKVGEN